MVLFMNLMFQQTVIPRPKKRRRGAGFFRGIEENYIISEPERSGTWPGVNRKRGCAQATRSCIKLSRTRCPLAKLEGRKSHPETCPGDVARGC